MSTITETFRRIRHPNLAAIVEFDERESAIARKYANIEVRRKRVDPSNSDAPLSRIVGNKEAVEILRLILFDALSNPIRNCDLNIAFIGPASSGKTTMSRLFAETLEIPFVELAPKTHKTLSDVESEIRRTLESKKIIFTGTNGQTFSVLKSSRKGLVLPSMVILLDEAHAFTDEIIEGLKKATERNDLTLATKNQTYDCANVCWHFATTDVGDLDDAFVSRFEPIRLRLYTK